MQTKMIFLDIDGTLVNDQKELPKKNKEAIDAALNMGHKVFICTGRPLSSVTKLLYPTIAKHFRTTDQKVERAIRNAIEISWNRGNVETFEKLFGYSVQQGKNRRRKVRGRGIYIQ